MEFVTTPKEDLQYASESISESIKLGLDSLAHFSGRLKELLPDLVHAFKGTPRTEGLPALPPLKGDAKRFVELVSKHSFLEMREIKAFVPQGLNAPFTQYLTGLEAAATRCEMMTGEILTPYVTFLAQLTALPEAARGSDDRSQYSLALRTAREDIYNEVKACFAPGSSDGRARLATVVERVADFAPVLQRTHDLVNRFEAIKRAKVDELVKQAETYLDIIHDRVQKGQLTEITPEVCKALADGAFEVACDVEFFAIAYFWVLGLKGSLENTMEEVTRVLQR